MSSGRKRVVSSCIPCYTRKQKVIKHQPEAFCHQTWLKVHTDNFDYSAIVNTLVTTVPGDNALKRVSIILLQQAKRLVVRFYQSPQERRHIETIRKDRAASH